MSSSDFHCIIKSDIMTSPHLMLLMLLLITFPKWKLRLPGHQFSWMIEWLSDWVHNFSPCASSAMEAAKETKFGTKVAWGWGWCPNIEYAHSAEKARDTTLDDEKYDVCNIKVCRIDRTCILVTALCNQPEVFTLDLGDDQSRYLLFNEQHIFHIHFSFSQVL